MIVMHFCASAVQVRVYACSLCGAAARNSEQYFRPAAESIRKFERLNIVSHKRHLLGTARIETDPLSRAPANILSHIRCMCVELPKTRSFMERTKVDYILSNSWFGETIISLTSLSQREKESEHNTH